MWAIEAVKNSVLITGLVMIMMFLLEYINVSTRGQSFEKLQSRPFLQIILSALLGFIPGCAGGFAVVSLYAHNMVSFGALMAMLVCTLGDDGFLMLAMIPKTAVLISFVLLGLGILTGWICDRCIKKVPRPFSPAHFSVHEEAAQNKGRYLKRIKENFRHLSWQRAVLLAGMVLFSLCVLSGLLNQPDGAVPTVVSAGRQRYSIFSEVWIHYLFAALALLAFLFTLSATEHFVKEHLWQHIIKQHFLKIFLWTSAALLIIDFAMQYLDLQHWLAQRYWIMFLVAVLIGLIPESGPNTVFITLFATGTLPLSILIANSLVQDGHASLPLLAESKKGFVISKALKICMAFIICIAARIFSI